MNNSKEKFVFEGDCPICEKQAEFVSENPWFRDYLVCTSCFSIPRERALMQILSELRSNWRELHIHESSPANRGASLKLKKECPGYIESQYFEDIEPGQIDKKHRCMCQDLGNQSFNDENFDVVITQDVFEHLPKPDLAIREIARTLKPGGLHIASVPLVQKWKPTIIRAKLINGKINHILPEDYHGSPVGDGKSLVFTEWGYDIAAYFYKESGMDTIIYHINDINAGIRAEYIEIVVSSKKNSKVNKYNEEVI